MPDITFFLSIFLFQRFILFFSVPFAFSLLYKSGNKKETIWEISHRVSFLFLDFFFFCDYFSLFFYLVSFFPRFPYVLSFFSSVSFPLLSFFSFFLFPFFASSFLAFFFVFLLGDYDSSLVNNFFLQTNFMLKWIRYSSGARYLWPWARLCWTCQ